MRKNLLNLCLTALMCVVSTTAWALSKVDGVYQIGTAEDLKAFAELVNSTEPYANAILTADIDKGTDNTQIGRDGQDFQGVFDGAGHTITYNMTFTENGGGLFRNVGVHAVIKDLKVQGAITTSAKFAGGIAGWNSGRILGCYIDVNIISQREDLDDKDATHGGLVGIAYRGTVITNCLSKIDIDGESTTNCGGVVGWANDKINVANCLIVSDGSSFNTSNGSSANVARNGGNLNVVNLSTYNSNPYANRPAGANYNNYATQQWGNNNATEVVPLADLADGKICYQLNSDQSKINWVQTIGTDPFPVPAAFGEGQVYASGATGCNGKADGLTYSNEGTAQATAHTFDKYGICTTCGCFNFDGFEFDAADNAVLLKTTNDIYLAEGWNRIGDGFKLNMKMADDIEVIAPAGQFIFNTSNWVDGNFDGQGHTLTIQMTNVGEHAAFIPEMTGNFENVIMHGSISTSGSRAGSISANGRMALIRNVYSDINITSSLVGDNTSGGFCGWMGEKEKRVENCIYAGTFKLPGSDDGARCARVGGFSGWAATKTYFTNCAVLGKFIGAGNQTLDNDTENSGNVSRNYGNVVSENVYVLNPITGNSITDSDKYIHYTNTEGIANGELAFLLNGNQNGLDRFYQLIGTDPEPMPVAKEGALVYSNASEGYRCDGTPLGDVTYSNTPSTAEIPGHTNADGWCSVCGNLIEDYMTPVNGWYEISNATQLAWWSNYATKYPTVKARLTADINMDGKMTRFAPIGSQANIFVGEFDGQGHRLSNFVYSGGDYSGLFGVIGGGAVIKNFVLDNTCSISGGYYCGIIGGTNGGGNVYLTNLGNEGPVTGGRNTSGIIGVDMGGAATLYITNCYVTGAIKGNNESAVICSWSNENSVVKNCWSTATLVGKYGDYNSFTRGSTSVVNCYEIEGVGTQNTENNKKDRTNLITAAEVASGSLCAKLAEGWYQAIGTDAHPVWDKSHGIVKEITEAGYATMYIDEAVNAPAGVAAYTGTIGGSWLTLNPIEGTIPAWEPVVLKGAAGFYSFKPAEAAAQADELTWEGLGLVATNASYNPFSGKSFTSPAEYAGTASSGQGKYIQLRTKNSNEGIVTTTSGGKLKSVTIAFNTATFDRSIKIYGKNEPYTDATDLYNSEKQGTLIGVIAANDETFTVTPTESFKYVGMASSNGAIYIDKITVEWEGSVPNIEGNDLKGTAEDIEAAGKYVLTQPEGKVIGFYLADQGTIKAGKAYLEGASGIKAFLFNDEATGISNVNVIENGAIYNLAGQRLNKMQKGINIINGKKVLK